MTGAEIMAVVGFFVMLFGVLSGVWWRIEGKVSAAEAKTQDVAKDLAAHKLHVAETYVSKQGHREATEQIMHAIQGVKGAVEHLGGRIDALYSGSSTTRRTTTK